MLLSKEIAVYLNLVGCKLKQYTALMLRQNQIGLTPEQFLLIDVLWNEGKMTQQQLADTMRKDKNSITKLIDALERKELLVRVQSKRDRRANIIVLTEKAEEMKLATKEKGISLLEKILEGIPELELRSFLTTLNKLSDNMTAQTQALAKTDDLLEL